MGTVESTHNWQPPSQPLAHVSSGAPVDYHMVASQVALRQNAECACFPKIHVTMESEDLYAMLGEQFSKGYRMLYFTRRPGDLRLKRNTTAYAFFIGYFRQNPNLGEHLEGPVSWNLRVERSWVQSNIERSGGIFSPRQRRLVGINQLVDSITRNTQRGERLVAATETGHSEAQTYSEFSSGLSPNVALDLFFEVPSPAPREHFEYNIALIPTHVEYPHQGPLYFPEIQCDWMATFQLYLSQGWRLIDIYVDTPMMEQFRVPPKKRLYFCRPTDTNGVWIFERPASAATNPRPLFEGVIREETVPVEFTRQGVKSSHDWMPLIKDMGMRGWELCCVVESHKVESSSTMAQTIHIKSLLFFQRPFVA